MKGNPKGGRSRARRRCGATAAFAYLTVFCGFT
jgi:hypothetical protein